MTNSKKPTPEESCEHLGDIDEFGAYIVNDLRSGAERNLDNAIEAKAGGVWSRKSKVMERRVEQLATEVKRLGEDMIKMTAEVNSNKKLIEEKLEYILRDIGKLAAVFSPDDPLQSIPTRLRVLELRYEAIEAARLATSGFYSGALQQTIPVLLSIALTSIFWVVIQLTALNPENTQNTPDNKTTNQK